MYINKIEIRDFRSFRKASIEFLHPDQDFKSMALPLPRLMNVNLVLGNNGFGKTTLLKAIALACLGPAVGKSGIYPYHLIRQEPSNSKSKQRGADRNSREAFIRASFTTHDQDHVKQEASQLVSEVRISGFGDLEELEWVQRDDKRAWQPIFSAESDAFFFVGYGASRRVEQKDRFDPGLRRSRVFVRAQRVQSLFEDTYSLVPLNSWLPAYAKNNKGRFVQVVNLLNALVGKEHYQFTGKLEDGEYLFERGGLQVPFPALSDGYRAFLGWVGDLLYHVCMTCPSGKKLVENRGVVMVDEIDLHLHPKWQMEVLPTLAKVLPNIQFIVTSHSPLIVGSLEWMNIVLMRPVSGQATKMQRIESPVHGLDADQVLLTDFFGLSSTRASTRQHTIRALSLRARNGDTEAAEKLLAHLAHGTESSE